MTYQTYEQNPIFQQALADARRDLATGMERQRPTRPAALWVLDAALIAAVIVVALIGYGLANNRWYRIVAIDGASMQPTLVKGDAIVLTRPPAVLEEGMIVTLEVDGQVVTHRVVSVEPDGEFITKGDANAVADDWSGLEVEVVGVQRARIPILGRLLTTVAGITGTQAWQSDRVSVGGSAGAVYCFGECAADGAVEELDVEVVEESMSIGAGVETSVGSPTDSRDEVGAVPEEGDEIVDEAVPIEGRADVPADPATDIDDEGRSGG